MFFLFFWRQWNEGFRNITHDPKWSCNSKFETWVAFICFIFPVTSSQCTKLKNALNSEFLLGECYQVLRIGRQYFLTDTLPRNTHKALLRKYSDIFSSSGETGPVLAEQRILTGWVTLGSKYSATFFFWEIFAIVRKYFVTYISSQGDESSAGRRGREAWLLWKWGGSQSIIGPWWVFDRLYFCQGHGLRITQ